MVKKPKKEAELRPLMVRMPEGLRKHLETEAQRNGRSMNSEIVHRLSQKQERLSLLEEVLKLAYGDAWGAFLFDAHRHGALNMDASDKKRMLEIFEKFIDQIPQS